MAELPNPNIVILYADDLGFGDLSSYGSTHISTPNIDRLAAAGLRFEQAYATSATCTPSRYSLLTGSYPWRNPLASILPGDAALIIGEEEPTMPKMLQQAGYRTGIVGKWHLGLGRGEIEWNGSIDATPNDVGFDDSYIIVASNDRVPCVYVENRRVVGLDPNDPIEVAYDPAASFPGEKTGKDHPELLDLHPSHGHDGTIVNGISRIGHMRGGTAALWSDVDMGDHLLARAKEFVSDNRDGPFFLHYAFPEPHVPRVPNPQFAGATDQGPRGDVVVELDWTVGELLDHLEAEGITDNTIVFFSSDNGPVVDDGYRDGSPETLGDHRPAGPLRGGKYSLYDGGTRVPTIMAWPTVIEPGVSHALVCQVDLFASFATLLGRDLQPGAAPDSANVLPALLGRDPIGRNELVVEGIGAKTVFRSDEWAYIPPHDGPPRSVETNIELGNSPEIQLYDLRADVGQTRNLADQRPELCARFDRRLAEIRAGRMTRS